MQGRFKCEFIFCCLLCALRVNAQTNISGTINSCYPVLSVDYCNNLVALPLLPGDLFIGDRVMLIQMQGATIDLNDAATYGSISSYNTSGDYEILTIASVVANIITFKEVMLHQYDANGIVQLVKVPQYVDVNVTGNLTPQSWNGTSGGVIAFEATGTVTLNADIDASSDGFSGGGLYNHPGCYGGGVGYGGYRCDQLDNCGGVKGTGIADNGGYELGRGAPANGGGGGNNHNTGGGGGSNAGSGGVGGQRLNTVGADCIGANPGIGGYALTYSNADNKIFMGGGGGAGDENSNEATAGGNGGGIILITANNLVGNNLTIRANGGNVAGTANRDGAGGGGGGGTILLNVANYTGNVNVEVKGGAGGNVDNGSAVDSCFGPGGGGGGGMVWESSAAVSPNTLLQTAGGVPGLTLNGNAPAACLGLSNGATAGAGGNSLSSLIIPESTTIYVPLTIVAPTDTTICVGDFATMGAGGTGTGALTFTWSDGSTGDTVQLSPTQTTAETVTITDSRGCSITAPFNINVQSVTAAAFANPSSIIQGETVQLNCDTAGIAQFFWDPASYLNSNTIFDPVSTPDSSITYCLTVTGNNTCVDTACVSISVFIPTPTIHVPNAFTPNGDGLNDLWIPIINPCYTVTYLRIYNRWGVMVYDNVKYGSLTWDGTHQGVPEPTGTYVYYIYARCSEFDRPEVFKGNVTLIR